jgi:ATP-dependent Clp protease ATP-binding subunit ClpA
VAKIARIPPQHVSADDRSALKNLDRDLKNMVFGQDAAIDALAKAIKMSRSGLGDPQKPIGCFLFRARPASARPRSRANWPMAWASN